uniref:Uncharacterized protein n=1 Tax=Anguilla anguilla TaxID=7936 RepID=A0A0E9SZI3_ANGAN
MINMLPNMLTVKQTKLFTQTNARANDRLPVGMKSNSYAI